ncbi:MAG: 6-hydroxymethyl-7,8-dihydropterin pyrophosphokinase [Candidatus Thorarchaeota archaeon]|nr:MAG: 6-hydroxymethyl-7,8-dihydropterin pyrophosphokinase [Candidatus Thorarchaeota archaeon]RLI60241.1 MAG: 6-hydroxymethyl-7,8-dihydropterin pyrophosphokinase [Candidatus Thorarchaeota archaeon]
MQMRWTDWKPFYDMIVEMLSLDPARDRESTRILTQLLEEINPSPLLTRLERIIRGRTVVVCGSGPSLHNHLKTLENDLDVSKMVFMAADGAITALQEENIGCAILVTDLDGPYESIIKGVDDGALTIVHGHGDNIPVIERVVPDLGPVLGSTQVEPTKRAFLWGGFTDGDRACYVASHYAPKRIVLAGMDFGEMVGRWSKPGHENHYDASERKKTKLRIAEKLIRSLLQTTSIDYTMM